MSDIIKECLINIGFDIIKDKVIDRGVDIVDEIRIRDRLDEFISRQEKYNDICTKYEEVDFKAVADYLRGDLIEDVRKRLFGDKIERGNARDLIISKIRNYAKANTVCGEKRAIAMVDKAIEIMRMYYRNKVNSELKFLMTEAMDNIVDESKRQHKEQTQEIIYAIKKISEQNTTDPIEQIVLENKQLIREGKYSDVENNVTRIVNGVFGTHELYPYYDFKTVLVDGKIQLVSYPLSEEAINLYPPQIMATGTARMKGKYLYKLTPSVINYANRHQIPIVLNIQEATKMLGDKLDPLQHEAEAFTGKNIVISPKPFPPAFACSISFNNIVEFDYILFRTQEILDDGTMIVSNIEQENSSFFFEMRVNIEKKSISFHMEIKDAVHIDVLHYVRVMKKAEQGEILSIKVLKYDQEFARGILENVKYQSSFNTIDEEIEFLEMVVLVEDYLGVTFDIPEEIYDNEYEMLCYLYKLIKGDVYKHYWKDFGFSIELTEELRRNILSFDGVAHSISYVGTMVVPLWSGKYEIPIIRSFPSVCLENLDKIQQKAIVLDIGDDIKLKYIPSENDMGVMEDRLKTDMIDVE